MRLLIKGGQLIDPATNYNRKVDILIVNGLIAEIATIIDNVKIDHHIDASNLVVSPGFVDMHVHLREPGQEEKETILTGSRAAVRGGFTSIAVMPNTDPVNDNPAVTRQILAKAEEANLVNIFPIAAVTKQLEGIELVNIDVMSKAGVMGFSDDGRCVMSSHLMKKALSAAKQYHLPIIQHPEDHSLTQKGQMNEGIVSQKVNLPGIPAQAEDSVVARDIKLQAEIKGKLHITHLSTSGAINLVKDAKIGKVNVTVDVTPHHLLLTESLILNHQDAVYKMKPPLRTEKDRLTLIEGLTNNVIDCIASDHAPHTPQEKVKDFSEAPFGVIGMETSFCLIYDRFVRTGIISLKRLIELFSTNPARILNLNQRGRVKPGLPADLTLLNLNQKFRIKAEDFESKSVNCPFIGWEGVGCVEYTIVGGKIAYQRLN